MNCIISNHKKGDTWFGITATIIKNNIPLDLTNYTAISCFRKVLTGISFLEFNTNNNTLLIPNPINGKIFYQKRIIDIDADDYFFDLQIISPNGNIKTILEGKWKITQDIS